MTVYVDNMYRQATVPNGGRKVTSKWCHLTADTTAELHEMADRIGLRRSWVQNAGTWTEHYDVTLPRRAAAVAAGAMEVDFREHTRATALAARAVGARLIDPRPDRIDRYPESGGSQ